MRILYPLLVVVSICWNSIPACAQANLGEAFIFDNGAGTTMPYRLLAPPTVPPDSRLPLIVFLHGAGERGQDNSIQMRLHINGLREVTATEPYASFLVAPQLPAGDTFWSPTQPYDLTTGIIDHLLATYPIDPSRIYVTGLSLGGFGSFNYISAYPEKFAAAIPMSGWGDPATAPLIKDIPTWIFHGDRDSTVPVSSSREMFYSMDSAGGGPRYTDIIGGDHVIWSPLYSDWKTNSHGIFPWLFAQRLPAETSVQLITSKSSWSFLDDGSNPPGSWNAVDFDDAAWKAGVGPLGYGERDEITTVNCGPDTTCRADNFATTFFRHEFQLSEVAGLDEFALNLVRDDSAAVYVNGTQVFRDSRLAADATFQTYAGNGENSHIAFSLDSKLFVEGTNVIGVEIHQQSATSNDLTFDVRLTARAVPEPGCLPVAAIFSTWIAVRRNRKRIHTFEQNH